MRMNRKSIVILSTLLMVVTSMVPVGASMLSLNIATPSPGQIFTNHTVNVTGTAWPTNTSWVQTSKADFDQGTSVNVTVSAGGNITLNSSTALIDDFNDNYMDPSN